MVQKPGPGGMWRYGYDSEHRMTEAVLDTPDATGAGNTRHRVIFTYDPFGRRTEKRSVVTVSAPDDDGVTVPQEVTTFVWEGYRLLAETRNGLPLVYVYEGAGSYTPLARIYGTGDKQRMDYYRCSHNGMPQALTDEDGKLHWRQDVETWGETRSEYADEEGGRWRKIWGGAPEENLRFAGQYLDRETGLHYNTFRYYAPDMGRFITPDPIGLLGGWNLYQYAPNPLGWIDPLGLYKGEGERGLGKYHVFHEHALDPSEYDLKDSEHFRRGNQSVYERLQKDSVFKQEMQTKYPGVVEHVQPNSRGNFSKYSPPDMTWHHENQPGVLSLVDYNDHKSYHKIYHPDGSGGRHKWGGGKTCR